jgi:hypothetical protein
LPVFFVTPTAIAVVSSGAARSPYVAMMTWQPLTQRPLTWGVLALLTGLAGCSQVSTVQAVQAHPHRNWFTATVYLRGTVGDRVPLIGEQVYQLQDSSGKIWVLASESSLKTGDRVLIKGRVQYQSIPVAELELGEAYIEQRQLLEKNGKKIQ